MPKRKKAQELLKESEEKLNAMLQSISDHMSMMDKDLNILWTNETAKKVFGDAIIGKKCYEVYHKRKEPCEPHPCLTLKAFQDGKVHEHDTQVIDKNGDIIYFHCTANAALRDKDGKPTAVLEISRDITDCKRAEEALRESEKHYRETLDAMGDWILAVDKNFKIIIFNEVFKRISKDLGLTTEVIGRTPMEIFPFSPPSLLDEYQWVFENKKTLITEETTKVGDREFVTESRKIPLLKHGEIVKIVSVVRDITDKKRLETSLQHAQKMESIGILAGGIAHEFNNLLTAIIGYGNLLKTEVCQNDFLMAYVTQILNSAERAATLTHGLLSFSRRQMINPRPVNVNNIINSIKDLIQRTIGEDIEFSILLSSKNLTVMADKHQIEQVLINLVTNARDAMPDGGNLTIRTEYSEIDNGFIKKHGYSSGSYALISVEDTGQGMDEETKERIFDPFYTTKEVGKGTGLGLSMTYGIIKQHNGYIDVQTEHGKGTTFNVYLPLTTLTVEDDKKPGDLPILKGGMETILIAEDETYVRDFIKEMLTGYGYKVIDAIDGEDAIKVLHTHKDKIQLSLLDVIMPKKNGKEVYEEIKKVSPHMKVIFISGYATDILYKKGIIEEGVNFITKPMSPAELLIKVREVLDS